MDLGIGAVEQVVPRCLKGRRRKPHPRSAAFGRLDDIVVSYRGRRGVDNCRRRQPGGLK